MSLTNKVAWITGASSGIGEELAYSFAKQGAKLVLSSRREEELKRVKQNCETDPANVLILPLDLEETKEMDLLTHKVVEKFGRIDILINNGGISQRSYTKDTPLSIDRKIMEINFFGTIAVTKSVLPHMLKQKSGHIVVISSISGKFGFFLRSAYSASKHALHGFFESLRMEVFKDNIKILMVCPGKIKTNISINAITENGEKHNRMDEGQNAGMAADVCAEKIIGAIRSGKKEIFIGGKELMAVWVKRFLPNLFFKLIRKRKIE